jgi:hypothetical protein
LSALRISTRIQKLLETLWSYARNVEVLEPRTIKIVLKGQNMVEWKQAMDEKYEPLVKNQTWARVPLPIGKKETSTKWVFKQNKSSDAVEKYKAQLMVKVYTQI